VKNVDHSFERIKEATPNMWQDFYQEKRPFGKVVCYRNDFTDWVADSWTITEVGTSLQKVLDERNGILSLISGGSENDGNNMQLGGSGDSETIGESFAPAAGKNLWFETRISGNDVDQNDIFVGLSVQDTAVVASLGQAYIGFYSVDESAALNFASAAASVASTSLGITTLADATYIKLGFKVTSTDKVEAYINDVLTATITTSIPTELMKLTFAHLTGEGSANELNIDYVAVCQDR
jgi:hypothetical protein